MKNALTPWRTRPSVAGTDYIHVENPHGLTVGCFKRANDAESACHAVNHHETLVEALRQIVAGNGDARAIAGAALREVVTP